MSRTHVLMGKSMEISKEVRKLKKQNKYYFVLGIAAGLFLDRIISYLL